MSRCHRPLPTFDRIIRERFQKLQQTPYTKSWLVKNLRGHGLDEQSVWDIVAWYEET